jgi:cell division protein FtsI (penicillin-binding protein 3)
LTRPRANWPASGGTRSKGIFARLGDAHLRIRVLRACILFFFACVGVRLVDIQIVHSAKYRDIAQKQYEAKVPLPAVRGVIFDRGDNPLATNTVFVSYAADPQLASEDANAIASKFSQVFGKPKKYYLAKLNTDSRFVWLERQVSPEIKNKIDPKKFTGLVVRDEPKRLYHNDHVAGQLIGVTNIDNRGLAGVELEYDDNLRGDDGYVIFQRDGRGKARPSVDYPRVEPTMGHNIYLTIDRDMQAIAEKALQKGVVDNDADRGVVVVMQPATGEVLAIGQYPAVDPNSFGKYDPQDTRLRAVTDVFEPGSVFKLVTVASALENHLIAPEQKFSADHGKYTVTYPGGKIRLITDTHEYDMLTFQEAMEFSSNIVMAKASNIIGAERFFKMARGFGFGTKTHVEYPGEVQGTLSNPSTWSALTLNSMAYGYEVQTTALQITAAYCAVANKGILMKPMLFKKETDAQGALVQENHPEQIRRVISLETSELLKKFLIGVVEHGTGKPARIEGMTIAGKTGTSKKNIDGRYDPGSYRASFVGFFPAENPELVCFVMMDNPRGLEYYGGTTSAPVFRSIAEQIINTSEMFATAVASRTQVSGTPRQAAAAKTPAAPVAQDGNVIPDVRGYSVRQAVSILRRGRFMPVISGSGTVVNEDPAPGRPAQTGMKITLICQPKSYTSLSSY